ncbi:MAG: PAS domain S-box protein [Thermodesulfobacteriota bacterium]
MSRQEKSGQVPPIEVSQPPAASMQDGPGATSLSSAQIFLDSHDFYSDEVISRNRFSLALAETERLNRSLLTLPDTYVWLVDMTLRYTYVSSGVESILGYTVEEMLAMNAGDSLTEASRQTLRATLARELMDGNDYPRWDYPAQTVEIQRYHKDGSLRTHRITGTFLRNPLGQPVGILGIARDVSDAVSHGDIRAEQWIEMEDRLQERTLLLLKANREFRAEAIERNRAQESLIKARDELETRVQERTAGLAQANEELRKEILRRKRLEKAVKESEARYRKLADNSLVGVAVLRDGTIEYANECLAAILRHRIADMLGRHFLEFIHPDDREMIHRKAKSQTKSGEPFTGVLRVVCGDGKTRWIETYSSMMQLRSKSYVIGNIVDVTERVGFEQELKKSLAEKEVLLREIHHRVKNNLTMITSLLNLHMRRTSDESLRNVLKDIQKRILSMAMVHDTFYRGQDAASVKIRSYVGGLVDHLIGAYDGISGRLSVRKQLADQSVGLDAAIPLGLIITELISNCFKHAFPDGRSGEVAIEFHPTETGQHELIVRDDGVGLPDSIDVKDTSSLGLSIVRIFVTQLDGDIQVKRDNGTTFRISFPSDIR